MTSASTVKEVTPRQFHIFGQGISFSMSPIIHNAAFKHYNLPHTYDIRQSVNIDDFEAAIREPSFGGGSVTMPHKLNIGKFCDDVTEEARIIGAINTLIPTELEDSGVVSNRRRIIGDNTDWSGLASIIRNKAQTTPQQQQSTLIGLVIGAGGASRAAAYALHMSGAKEIYLVNRNVEKARQIAADYSTLFSVTVMTTLQELVASGRHPDIIIGTIPAEVTNEDYFPESLFEKPQGVCLEMSYKPRVTPLLVSASKHPGWQTVTGVEVLLAQGFEQFRLWTGLEAPQEEMSRALYAHDTKT